MLDLITFGPHLQMKLVSRFGIALAILCALAILIGAHRLSAAPPSLTCSTNNASISAPQVGSTLNGIVQIEGVASLGGQFQYYKVEFSPSGRDDFGGTISGVIRSQVSNGQLAVWDSASVPDGVYSLRLRVVDVTGNYCDIIVTGLKVQNSVPIQPTEEPTAVETEAPPEPAVVPTAVPTIQIGAPTEATGATAPTPSGTAQATRTPGSNALIPGGINTDSIVQGLGDVFGSLGRIFFFGVVTMAGVMLVVGVIFFVRRVL